ncbi:MAG: SEC-C domain-containing protein, partial [Actinobacteria bacterium]|nr:SEC-C domain-containing protein [Actinomycetota bacterium]
KNEAFALVSDLMNTIWNDFARLVYNVEVQVEGRDGDERAMPPQPEAAGAAAARNVQYSGGSLEDQPTAYGGEPYAAADAEEPGRPVTVQQRRVDETEQLGRNDPCWCGSGKKFKKCHGA